MKANSLHFQLIGLILLTLVPWPGPTVFKIKCPRDSAAVVRRLIQNKWIPVLEKYQVKLPLDCPFHPMRDIFYPQEAAKRQYRPSQWTCGFCGKSFYQEKYLDLHFDNRHRNKINMAEDAVCLADYCDIMRCEVLQAQYEKQNNAGNGYSQHKTGKNIPITDLEVWREPSQRTALSVVAGSKKAAPAASYEKNAHNNHHSCDKSEAPKEKSDHESENRTSSRCETLVDSVLPPRQRFVELQKLKANCKAEDLLKLKHKCEDLVRDCIAGLLVNLSVQDFKDIEGELNNAVCWYLTCDRYWEDTQSNPRNFSWGLIFIPVGILSLGLTLCYYIIWIFFDSNDLKPADEATLQNYPSYRYVKQYSDEYYPASDENPSSNDHYIYVTYPPEIKRKLLDSCYNRTTRL